MTFTHPNSELNNDIYDNLTGIALSDRAVLFISTIGFAILGIVLYFLILRHSGVVDDIHDVDRAWVRHHGGAAGQENVNNYGEILDQSDAATLNRAQRRARAKFRMKKARRAALNQQVVGDGDGEADEVALRGDVPLAEWVHEDAKEDAPQLTRRERQKAAKAMEKQERKQYAEEARVRRERESKSTTMTAVKSGKISKSDGKDTSTSNNKIYDLKLVFPRKENDQDPLSEYLFWESIISKLKNKLNSSNFEDQLRLESRKMTINAFLQVLQTAQSIPIVSLANEFGITIPEVLEELEKLNQRFGIVGLHDGQGQFVYVSKEMIEEAVLVGKREGKIIPPNLMNVS